MWKMDNFLKWQVLHMFERWKKRYTFMDDVNIITKLLLGITLFFFVIFIHNFDYMLYISALMFIFLMLFNGTELKITLAFLFATILFALTSSLFMILYGNGEHFIFKLGIIQISTESIVYSLMQHLKIKPKIAYAFMAAIRMVPLIISSLIQLRRSLKMRYQMIDKSNYKGLKRFKHLLIPILSQNIRRAHQLSVAMETKGFKDGPRTYYYNAPFSYKDVLLVLCFVGIILLSFYLSAHFPITGIQDARVSGKLS